jgi:hypothetical protein
MNALRFVVALTLALTLSCSRCKSGTGASSNQADIVSVVPKGAVVVAVAPSLAALGAKLEMLQRLKVAQFASQLQGFGSAAAFGDALMQQIGFDLRDPKALTKAGLDAQRPMAVFVTANMHTYVVLPVLDETQFFAALKSVSARRLGAALESTMTVDNVMLHVYRTAERQPPRVACVLKNGYALVATDDGTGALSQFAAMPLEATLSSDSTFEARRKADASAPQVWVYFPSGSPALSRVFLRDWYASATLNDSALTIDSTGHWQGDAAWLDAVKSPAKPVDILVPADAFLTVQTLSPPQQLTALAKQILDRNKGALEQAQLELGRDVFDLFSPGTVAALSMAEKPPIGQGLPHIDIRKTNPFRYVQLSGVAPLKAGAAIEASLQKLTQAAPRFGANIATKTFGEHQLYLTTYSQGEGVHVSATKEALLFASPQPRLEALLQKQSLAPLKTNSSALTATLHLNKLTRAIRELPADAWGLGGSAIKATSVRWLDATDDLTGLQVKLDAAGQDLHSTVTLSLTLPNSEAPATR